MNTPLYLDATPEVIKYLIDQAFRYNTIYCTRIEKVSDPDL